MGVEFDNATTPWAVSIIADFLFIAARHVNRKGESDILWAPDQTRRSPSGGIGIRGKPSACPTHKAVARPSRPRFCNENSYHAMSAHGEFAPNETGVIPWSCWMGTYGQFEVIAEPVITTKPPMIADAENAPPRSHPRA